MEIWKDIPDYEGLYQVSNLGNVRSLDRYEIQKNKPRFRKGQLMALNNTPKGYLRISLSKNDKQRKWLVHILVMRAFVGKSELHVNHIDRVRNNNNLTNLEYLTCRDNVIHSIDKTKTVSKYIGIFPNTNKDKWIAKKCVNGKVYFIGTFETEEIAHQAYLTFDLSKYKRRHRVHSNKKTITVN